MKVQRRRGISPIIAELLLVAVTVVLGTSIFFIGSSSIGGYANGFSVLFGKSAAQAQEIYVVEYAQFTTNGTVSSPSDHHVVDVTVRNVGSVETEVADISFFALASTSGPSSGTFGSSAITNAVTTPHCTKVNNMFVIPVGNFCTLQVPFDWTAGTPYNMVVSTGRGNSIVVQEVA